MDKDKNNSNKQISPLHENFDVMNIDLENLNLQADFIDVSDDEIDAFSHMLEELDQAVKERKTAVILSNEIQTEKKARELTDDDLDLLLEADKAKDAEATSYWQANDLISREATGISEINTADALPSAADFTKSENEYRQSSFWKFMDRIVNREFFGKRLTDLPHLVLGLVAGLLLLFVVSVFVVAFSLKSRMDIVSSKPENAITISNPLTNNSNQFMYIGESKYLDDEKITLVKMLLDDRATIFFLDKYLDASQYAYQLTDNLGFDYDLDQDFSVDEQGASLNRTMLRFIPVNKEMSYLDLQITSKETEKSIAFLISFDTPPKASDTLWYTGKDYPFVIDDLTTVLIDEAYFSSTGNSLFYSLHSKDITEKFIFAQEEISSVFLLEGAKKLLNYGEGQRVYEFAKRNILAGRIDTFPLQSYGSKMSLLLTNLIHEHEVNQDIQARDLYYKNMDKPTTIEKNKYSFVLEGLDLQGDKVVLVAHGEVKPVTGEKHIIPNLTEARAILEGKIEELMEEDISPERIRISIDADLLYVDADGMEKTTKGICRSKDQGADITFNIDNLKGQDNLAHMTVRINTISAYIDEIQLPIYLEKSKLLPNKEENTVEFKRERDIEAALLLNSATGSNWDDVPKQHFSFVAKTTNAGDTSTSSASGKDIFYSTIKESRKGLQNNVPMEETYIHQITATSKNNEWIILQDDMR